MSNWNETNYLIWKEQIRPVAVEVRSGNDSDLPGEDTQEYVEPNPEFNLWDRKDKIVMNWIYNSVSQSHSKYLFGNKSVLSYWTALERNFTDSSPISYNCDGDCKP